MKIPLIRDIGDLENHYRDWLLDEVDLAICRCSTNLGWGDPIHFLRRRAWARELVPPRSNLHTAIRHGDVNALNVLVDEDGLTGSTSRAKGYQRSHTDCFNRVIDWDTASWVPAPAAIQHPLFIANIPGIRNDDAPQDMDFTEDRAYLENAIRELCVDGSNVADLLATSRERQFFELSLRNKRVNEEYIRLRCGRVANSQQILEQELEEFFHKHAGMRDNPALRVLHTQFAVVHGT